MTPADHAHRLRETLKAVEDAIYLLRNALDAFDRERDVTAESGGTGRPPPPEVGP